MTRALRQAEKALRSALAKAQNYESPMLSADYRVALEKIARNLSKRLAALSPSERRLALQ
jgi:hypothetical protein